MAFQANHKEVHSIQSLKLYMSFALTLFRFKTMIQIGCLLLNSIWCGYLCLEAYFKPHFLILILQKREKFTVYTKQYFSISTLWLVIISCVHVIKTTMRSQFVCYVGIVYFTSVFTLQFFFSRFRMHLCVLCICNFACAAQKSYYDNNNNKN